MGCDPPPGASVDPQGRSLVLTYARDSAARLPETVRVFAGAYQMPARSNFVGMFFAPLFLVRPNDSKMTITVFTSETLSLSPLLCPLPGVRAYLFMCRLRFLEFPLTRRDCWLSP